MCIIEFQGEKNSLHSFPPKQNAKMPKNFRDEKGF
jgi:hypothetical protein